MSRILYVFLFGIVLLSCESKEKRQTRILDELSIIREEAGNDDSIKIAEIVKVETTVMASANAKKAKINQQCLSATTESNFKELNRVSNRKDEKALLGMISAGEVYVLEPDTKIEVIERGIGKKLVKTSTGLEVWVSTEFVTE